jgi:hypothetical protein
MQNKVQSNMYEIKVKGHLSERRAHALGDLVVIHTAGGETILRGHLQDQAALFGTLNRLRDLGISLIAVNLLDDEHASNSLL